MHFPVQHVLFTHIVTAYLDENINTHSTSLSSINVSLGIPSTSTTKKTLCPALSREELNNSD